MLVLVCTPFPGTLACGTKESASRLGMLDTAAGRQGHVQEQCAVGLGATQRSRLAPARVPTDIPPLLYPGCTVWCRQGIRSGDNRQQTVQPAAGRGGVKRK